MKFSILIVLLALSACSSRKESRERVENKTAAQEVRSIQEIHQQTRKMLDAHPEFTAEEKSKLQKCLDTAVEKHQSLRAEESQVVQLLLNKSLNSHKLTSQEQADRKLLNKKLNEIYKNKAQNIFTLTSSISEALDESKRTQFNDDMMIFFRDLR